MIESKIVGNHPQVLILGQQQTILQEFLAIVVALKTTINLDKETLKRIIDYAFENDSIDLI